MALLIDLFWLGFNLLRVILGKNNDCRILLNLNDLRLRRLRNDCIMLIDLCPRSKLGVACRWWQGNDFDRTIKMCVRLSL